MGAHDVPKYCPKCNKVYADGKNRHCVVDGTRLSIQDPFNLVGSAVEDKYRLDALVGIGGFGAVYCGHHLGIDRQVAVKILLPHLSVSDKKVCELFEREAKTAGRLRHENIVDVSDAGRTRSGIVYMVMEWLEGHTLEEEIDSQGQLSFDRAATILRQIAAALDEAHAAYIIHRDLKPSNIMIVKRPGLGDRVKVLDFGIAKVVTNTAGSTVSAIMGTPHYASPEQLGSGGNIDKRSDIYSLGVMLYHMLTGVLPLNAPSLQELILLHLNAVPRPLGELRADTPIVIESLVEEMLEKEAASRPRSAGEVSKRFDKGLAIYTLLLEARRAFDSGDFQSAISKWQEVLNLSPNEPEVMKSIEAAQEGSKKIAAAKVAQEEAGRRVLIDQLLRQASLAYESREYAKAIEAWEEVLKISPREPHVEKRILGAKKELSKIDQNLIKTELIPQQNPPVLPVKTRSSFKKIAIGLLGVTVIALILIVLLPKLKQSEDPITSSLVPTQAATGAQVATQGSPDPASKIEVIEYFIESEGEKGAISKFTEGEPVDLNKRFRFHFKTVKPGYLYIIGPGSGDAPTTFLTSNPLAQTGVKTNRTQAGIDFQFPTGWIRSQSQADAITFTVLYSEKSLQGPAFLLAGAGKTVTDAEQDEVRAMARAEVAQAGDHSVVKAAAQAEGKPVVFDIRLRRK